jgi:hypothetical protein
MREFIQRKIANEMNKDPLETSGQDRRNAGRIKNTFSFILPRVSRDPAAMLHGDPCYLLSYSKNVRTAPFYSSWRAGSAAIVGKMSAMLGFQSSPRL